MKSFTALIRNPLAFLCLGIVLAAGNTFGQQKTLKELIVGSWLLDSEYDQYQDGKKTNPWGPGVKGLAMYNARLVFLADDVCGPFKIRVRQSSQSRWASDSPLQHVRRRRGGKDHDHAH
jgi:hypothetical protein